LYVNNNRQRHDLSSNKYTFQGHRKPKSKFMFLVSFFTFLNWVYALYTFHFFFKIRMQANVIMRLGLLPLAEHFYLSKLFVVHFVYLINAEQQRSWQQETSLLGGSMRVSVSSTPFRGFRFCDGVLSNTYDLYNRSDSDPMRS